MKESEYWKIVFDRLNLKHKNFWNLSLKKLDAHLEKEFLEYRKLMI
jgi:hypothetical protein